MGTTPIDLIDIVEEGLTNKGYRFHNGNADTRQTVEDQSGKDWWYTSGADGPEYELGPTETSLLGAQCSALSHFFANAPHGVPRTTRPA